MLGRIKASGVTILVSTPYMDEAGLCDRIALILNGKIIDRGTPQEIISRYPDRLYTVRGGNMFRILKILRPLDGVLRCSSFGSECHVAMAQDGPDSSFLLDALKDSGMEDSSVELVNPGIEDCFIRLS